MYDRPYLIENIVEHFPLFGYLSLNNHAIIYYIWNLALLLIPFLLCKLLIVIYQKGGFLKLKNKLSSVAIGILWLLFIPNTPYVITEFRHINNYCPADSASNVCAEGAWLIPILFIIALTGWVVYVSQIRQMQSYLQTAFNSKLTDYFIWVLVPIIAFGLLAGLLGRFSSWELVTSTGEFMDFTLFFIASYKLMLTWLIYTFFLYLLYFAGNALLTKNGLFKNR